MISEVHLLYSDTDTMPGVEDDEYLVIEDCMSDDDDNGIDVVGEDVPLADESIYPERIGHHKIVQVYLNPDQVEENAGFLKAFLCARFVWVMVVGGNYASDDVTPAPLLSTFDYGFRKLKFIDLVEEPLTFKSCGVFRE